MTAFGWERCFRRQRFRLHAEINVRNGLIEADGTISGDLAGGVGLPGDVDALTGSVDALTGSMAGDFVGDGSEWILGYTKIEFDGGSLVGVFTAKK